MKSIILKTILILGVVVTGIFVSSGYLFLQSDKALINKIRDYNINSAMEALDKREEALLALNQKQMESTTDSIAKNSSKFLIDYDSDSLMNSLEYALKEESIQAIVIKDTLMKNTFLLGYKEGKDIVFQESLPDRFEKFTTLTKEIFQEEKEKIGEIDLYFDESIIINQTKKIKSDTALKIKNFNQTMDKELKESNTIKLYIAFGSLITILGVSSILLITFVNNPLKKLQIGLDGFFLFLQGKKETTSDIELTGKDEFGQMAKSLNENIAVSARLHEEINHLNSNLEGLVAQRTKELDEKSKKVAALLDNADQGFLSFGKDLIIDKEYSKECEKIFKENIEEKNIAELLFKDLKKREFFVDTLIPLLQEENSKKIQTIISLLQSEFIIHRKAIHVQYKIIDNERFMLIFTDITAKKILEKKINREKNILKMIVAVVSDSEEFFELFDEFETFIRSSKDLIEKDKTSLHNATELYRVIHTFKGLFSQKEMNALVSNLHKLESKLSEAMANQDTNNKMLEDLLQNSPFREWLEKDISIIKDVLGEEFFNDRGKITVQEETLSKIEENIIKIANKHNELNEYEDVVKDIKNLKNRSLYSMFATYPKLLDQLGERLEKSIYPLEVIVDKDLKVSDSLKPFIKSLIHVFRNCVDHGIESMDERCEIEKDEIGTISCTINKNEENLHIIIADDGGGIDSEKLRSKANALGIDLSHIPKEDIHQLIFSDGFTTKDEVSQISGRGVGMSAVKAEIEKLNGVIKVNSQKGVGTTFEFVVPMQ